MNRAFVLVLCAGLTGAPLASKADDVYRHCGRYGAGVIMSKTGAVCIFDYDRMQRDQDAAKMTEAQKIARRTVTEDFLAECRSKIKFQLKDPSSYKEWAAVPTEGGLIDYTASNGYGGPTRSTVRCTTMENIRE